ncbi:hypothetical protein I7I52_10618 [Histoplasma capsulatum]|uniref:Uncharacterized protein n=1 Tax=Ajellomyces capsulatus TaxID=5037 RepID=A0A8H7YZQ1_AJECA|nr:hypothetical protein I7I52_10618 [Histoplasma capsulatum]
MSTFVVVCCFHLTSPARERGVSISITVGFRLYYVHQQEDNIMRGRDVCTCTGGCEEGVEIKREEIKKKAN